MAIKTFSVGEVLTAADTNTYLANSGLTYITTASATSGTVLAVDNCFTSTYDAYRIVITRCSLTAGLTGCYLQMRAGGTNTSTNYYNIRIGYDYATAAAATSAVNNGANWELALITDTTSSACVIDIYNPQKALKTQYNCLGADSRTTSGGAFSSGGMLNNTSAYDGFSFSAGGNTFSNVSVTIYGYRKA
jgi:hypothetical protein